MIKKLSNLKLELAVLAFFILTHLVGLGNDGFNTDVWKWKARSYDFSTGVFTLNFEKTIQKYHPGVTLMWISTFGIKIYNLYYDVVFKTQPLDNDVKTVFELDAVQKFLIVTAIGITLAFVFYALKRLTNSKLALLFIFLLTFEPMYLALTRVMHLEGLMTTFMLASFLYYQLFLADKTKKNYAVISALFGACAVLTKTTALFLLPFVGLLNLLDVMGGENRLNAVKIKVLAKRLFSWFVYFLIFFIVIWPAMWTAPLKAVESLYKGVADVGIETEHVQLYFGKLVDDPGQYFYFVVLAYRSSLYLLIGLVGLAFVYNKISDIKIKKLALSAILFSFFYLLELIIPAKKLERYILPTISGLVMLASIFYYELYLRIANRFKKYTKYTMVLVTAFLLIPVFTAAYLHPNYLSYYNPVLGGLKAGIFALEPKWIFGQKEIADKFIELQNVYTLEDFGSNESLDAFINKPQIRKKLVVAFPEKYYTQLWPFIRQIGGYAAIADISTHIENSNFVAYPAWEDRSLEEDRVDLGFVDYVYLRGVPIFNVYKVLYVN